MMSESDEDAKAMLNADGLPKGFSPVPLPARTFSNHPGNFRVSVLVSRDKDKYRAGTSRERGKIADDIMDLLQTEQLNFVEKVDGKWKALTWQQTRDKIRNRLVRHPDAPAKGKPKAQAQAKATKSAPKNTTTQNATAKLSPALATPREEDAQTSKKRSHDELQAAITVSPTHEGSKNVLHVSGENMAWAEKETKGKRSKTKKITGVSQEKMNLLARTLQSKRVFNHIQALASKVDEDESVEFINAAVQIFLDKGNAKVYNSLVKFYPKGKKHLFMKSQELTSFLLESMQRAHPSLQDHKLTNLAIILGGSKDSGPQPTHLETLQPLQGPAEWFGIFMLSKNAPATIAYNMEDVLIPLLPSISDLRKIWPNITPGLLQKLQDNKKTRNYIQQCGRLFWADKKRRQEPGVAEQYSTTLMNDIPHCGPPCDKPRAVLFFVLEPKRFSGEPYNGKTQCTKEKLTLILLDELRESLKEDFKPEERQFLVGKMKEYLRESAEFGARDDTINLGNGELNQVLNLFNREVQDIEAPKKQLEVAEAKAEALKKQLEVAEAKAEALKKQVEVAEAKADERGKQLEFMMLGMDYHADRGGGD